MMRILYVAFPLLLAGCMAIDPHQFVGPNGNTAYSMRCSGMGRTLEACYDKAGELCPNGYTIVDSSSGTVGVPMNGGTMMALKRNLAIECK